MAQSKMKARKICLLLYTLLLTVSTVYAQERKVNFTATRLSAGRVMAEIEQQTGYKFGFEKAAFDTSQSVQLERTTLELTEALDKLTQTVNMMYLVRGRIIILSPNPTPQANIVAPQRTNDVYSPTRQQDAGGRWVKRSVAENKQPASPQQPTPTYPEPYSSYRDPDLYTPIATFSPRWAIKSNLLYGAYSFTPNLGVEFAAGKRATIEIAGGYNPWNWEGSEENNKKNVHFYIQPEYRWWTCEPFSGSYFGIHGLFVSYNVGQKEIPMLFKEEYQYEGWAIGGGMSYGYQVSLSKRWGLEFNVGVGAAYLDYKKYDCGFCGEPIGNENKWYFGPTKVGVSLLYLFK